MSRTLQFRRLGTATLANTTGANGELIINTTNKTLTVHDGTTPGGFALLNEATEMDIDQYARNTANTNSNNITIIQGVNAGQNTTINTKVSKSGDTMTGDLKFGGGGGILNLPTDQIAITANVDNDASGFIAQATGTSIVYANTDVIIQANTGGEIFAQWNFTKEGTLTFPDNTIQSTAFIGSAIDQDARDSANTASNNITIIQGVNNTQNTAINAAAQTVPQNPQSTDYTLQLTDAGKHIYYTQSSNTTLYIPTTSNVAFANGSTIMIVSRTSSGANVTVLPNTGVTMYLAGNTTSTSRNVTTYGMATLIQVEANTWFINGTGVS
jgi:hypothetical protein